MKNRKNLKLAKIFHWKINKSIKMADKRMPIIKQSLLKAYCGNLVKIRKGSYLFLVRSPDVKVSMVRYQFAR